MSAPRRGGLVDLLVPDSIDRRAIDETMADWRVERSRAAGRHDGQLAGLGGWLSVLRAVSAIAARQILGNDVWRWVGRSMLLAGLVSASFTVMVLLQTRPVEGRSVEQLGLLVLTSGTMALLPIAAALGPGLDRDRPAPVLGAAVMFGAVALLAALAGFIVTPLDAELARPAIPSVRTISFVMDRSASISSAVVTPVLFVLCGEAVRRRYGARLAWADAQRRALVLAFLVVCAAMVAASAIGSVGEAAESLKASRWLPAVFCAIALGWLVRPFEVPDENR